MEAVGRLAGGVAHDFNNLLTVILGEADLMREGLPPGADAAGLAEIRKAAERAAVLTHQLLSFSRRALVEPTVIQLNAVVADMGKMLRRLVGEDVVLEARLDPDGGSIRADRGQIEQVLANLVVNARDAMPRGGMLALETKRLTLDEEHARGYRDLAPGEYVQLVVSDTGTGMSDEVKAQIFEPFFTTKEPGKGTGLGLATTYGIVKQARGHIAVYSELGIGTTMRVFLPRVEADAALERTVAAPVVPKGSETILLVEDEVAVRSLAVRVLQAQGYRVLEAPTGEEALKMAKEHPGVIDLLLTDVVLPRIGGRELSERVRAARPDVKVLFMSGYTDDVILQNRLLERDGALLQKPFTRDSLGRKVREVLSG